MPLPIHSCCQSSVFANSPHRALWFCVLVTTILVAQALTLSAAEQAERPRLPGEALNALMDVYEGGSWKHGAIGNGYVLGGRVDNLPFFRNGKSRSMPVVARYYTFSIAGWPLWYSDCSYVILGDDDIDILAATTGSPLKNTYMPPPTEVLPTLTATYGDPYDHIRFWDKWVPRVVWSLPLLVIAAVATALISRHRLRKPFIPHLVDYASAKVCDGPESLVEDVSGLVAISESADPDLSEVFYNLPDVIRAVDPASVRLVLRIREYTKDSTIRWTLHLIDWKTKTIVAKNDIAGDVDSNKNAMRPSDNTLIEWLLTLGDKGGLAQRRSSQTQSSSVATS